MNSTFKCRFLTLMTTALGLVASVHAGDVTGTIAFGGFGDISVSRATTTVNFVNPFGAFGVSGDYLGVSSGSVTLLPFSYTGTGSGAALSAPVFSEWSFAVGSTIYSFDLTSLLSATTTPAGAFAFTGLGRANITGEQSSLASWSLSGTGPSLSFTFDVGTTTAVPGVPDGGTTAILLGAGLAALALLRRKLA